MAATVGFGLEANMSSACWHTSLKLSLVKVLPAIPAVTLEGNCLFHKPVMIPGQQVHPWSSVLHRSLTNSLAKAEGVSVKTLVSARSNPASGFGPNIRSISFLSILYAFLLGYSDSFFLSSDFTCNVTLDGTIVASTWNLV